MAVTLDIRFPWGRYHGTAWDRNANEGAPDWPPAPWRVLRALYATWQWYCAELDEAVVHSLLSKLAAAPRYHLPMHTVAHTRHYLPGPGHKPGVATETVKTFDTFVVMERNASLLMDFPVDLSDVERHALDLLAENLAYLGRADAIVEARVAGQEELPGEGWLEAEPEVLPTEGGLQLLGAVQPLDVASLTIRPRAVRAARLMRPPGSHWLTYGRPKPAAPRTNRARREERRPTAVRLALTGASLPALDDAVLVGHVLRQACLQRYGGPPEDVSSVLAGKSRDGQAVAGLHGHAHFLPVSTSGNPKLLDTVIVWAPNGLPERELHAILGVRRLYSSHYAGELRDGLLGVEAVGEVADVAPELCGPASQWRSVTPFAPTRHGRGEPMGLLADNLRRELSYRNLPDVDEIEHLPGPWLQFRRHRPNSERRVQARRAFGVRLTFGKPVTGPFVLGQLSHFGLGLFMPGAGDGPS